MSLCLAFGYAVDPLDGDEVIVDHVQDAIPADAQPVVSATVERFSRIRVISQGGGGSSDGPHALLVAHETAS